eukprot:358504-Chlamydomonas_euryale.AAC.7
MPPLLVSPIAPSPRRRHPLPRCIALHAATPRTIGATPPRLLPPSLRRARARSRRATGRQRLCGAVPSALPAKKGKTVVARRQRRLWWVADRAGRCRPHAVAAANATEHCSSRVALRASIRAFRTSCGPAAARRGSRSVTAADREMSALPSVPSPPPPPPPTPHSGGNDGDGCGGPDAAAAAAMLSEPPAVAVGPAGLGAWRLQAAGLAATAAAAAALSLAGLLMLLLFGWALVPAWLVLEACVFPARYAVKYARLNAQPAVHGPPEGYDGEAVFRRLVNQQVSMSKYLCIKAGGPINGE